MEKFKIVIKAFFTYLPLIDHHICFDLYFFTFILISALIIYAKANVSVLLFFSILMDSSKLTNIFLAACFQSKVFLTNIVRFCF